MDSGMFLPMQLAAVKALEVDEGWIRTLNSEYKKRRVKAFQILDLLNCAYNQNSKGLFVWAKIPEDAVSGENLIEGVLQKAKVFLTPGFIFGANGDRNIRISLCVPIQKFDEALVRIKNQLK
jgi:aspartate/methionine/tyrosine aminotransferase